MNNEELYYPLPQPGEVDIREREDAMGAYFMMFASIGAGLPLPVINLIAAIIYYYMYRTSSRFVRFHSLQSLLSQLPVSLLNGIAVFWGARIVFSEAVFFNDSYKGFLAVTALANLVYFAFSIVAAIKARKGLFYYFVFFGKIAYHHVYRVRPEVVAEPVNRPPHLQ